MRPRLETFDWSVGFVVSAAAMQLVEDGKSPLGTGEGWRVRYGYGVFRGSVPPVPD